jgi:hypothetical protein
MPDCMPGPEGNAHPWLGPVSPKSNPSSRRPALAAAMPDAEMPGTPAAATKLAANDWLVERRLVRSDAARACALRNHS